MLHYHLQGVIFLRFTTVLSAYFRTTGLLTTVATLISPVAAYDDFRGTIEAVTEPTAVRVQSVRGGVTVGIVLHGLEPGLAESTLTEEGKNRQWQAISDFLLSATKGKRVLCRIKGDASPDPLTGEARYYAVLHPLQSDGKINGESVNAQLLRAGLARWVRSTGTNPQYAVAEADASKARRGAWANAPALTVGDNTAKSGAVPILSAASRELVRRIAKGEVDTAHTPQLSPAWMRDTFGFEKTTARLWSRHWNVERRYGFLSIKDTGKNNEVPLLFTRQTPAPNTKKPINSNANSE